MSFVKEKYFRRIFSALAIFLGACSGYADECELSGVKFFNLSKEQISVLREAGASCKATSAKKNIDNEFKFGKPGFIMLDGKKISYLDLASDNAIKLEDKAVEVYGYIRYHFETGPGNLEVYGYRFDFEISEGEFTKPTISVVAAPSISKSYPEPEADTIASMRKKVFKTLTLAGDGKALIKIKGNIKTFSNTGQMYIGTEDSIDLIAK